MSSCSHRSHSRFGRRALSAILVGVFSAAGVAACAAPGPYNPSDLPSAELGQVRDICRTTLGIPAGFRLSQSCVDSLSRSMATLDQGRGLASAREQCLSQGLQPGQPGLAECELTATPARAAAATSPGVASTSAPPVKSYFYASSREIRAREQMACARLGFDPIYASFASCVAQLDTALAADEHAAH